MINIRILCLMLIFSHSISYAAENVIDESLYRSDQPQVLNNSENLKNQKKNDQLKIIEDFKLAYQKVEKPKFLMFWHRELSDDINSAQELSGTVSSTGELKRDNYFRVIKVQWKNGTERSVSLIPKVRDVEFASGFHQQMRSAGAILVDRNSAIRFNALDKTKNGISENEFNFQTIEAETLSKYAQYFIEINFIQDDDSKGGFEPRVTVIKTDTGEIVADVVPSHLYKSDGDNNNWTTTNEGFVKSSENVDNGQWKTDSKGFVKVSNKKTSIQEGKDVATELMKALVEGWHS